MDQITLQQEIEKAKLNPAFASYSDSQIRDMILGQTDIYGQGNNIGDDVPEPTPEDNTQQVAVEMENGWQNPYEYQGPTSVGEDLGKVAGIGKNVVGKGLMKSGIVKKGLHKLLGHGTAATMGPPTAAQAAAGGAGGILSSLAASPVAPLAIAALGIYALNKRRKKKAEKKRKAREERYKTFRETERSRLREGQEDYFSMASKYSNPYNID